MRENWNEYQLVICRTYFILAILQVNRCKEAQENPCTRKHYGDLETVAHTLDIHQLDPVKDIQLINKLMQSFGSCNFKEYKKVANIKAPIVVEEEDDLMLD